MKYIFSILRNLTALFFLFIFSFGTLKAQGITDSDISQAVMEEFMVRAKIPDFNIVPTTYEGIVTLDGEVDNLLAKERSIKIAKQVRGVKGVIDMIDVNPPEITDYELKERLDSALLYNSASDAYEITVKVNNGIITLNGEVESWREKMLAEKIAKGLDGTKNVSNNITFTVDYDRPDYEIKQDVESALKWDVRVEDLLVEVEVEDHEVNLSGLLGSSAEKDRAYFNAWVTGVDKVDTTGLVVDDLLKNEDLKSKKYGDLSDEDMEKAIENALFYDPRVNSFDLSVEVEDKQATISGVVDNVSAKSAAEQNARNIVGIWDVDNLVVVTPDVIPSDDKLVTRVGDAFFRDGYIDGFDVSVTASNGTVFLTGVVDSYFEKNRATYLASTANGVVKVNNMLNVKVDDEAASDYLDQLDWNREYENTLVQPVIPDKELKEDIEYQLWWSPYVDEDQVDVVVDNGEVTLIGAVDTKQEKRYAVINAIEGGADGIVNHLTVLYDSEQ